MEVKASRAKPKPKPRKCLPFVFIYFNVFAVISVIAVISVLPCSVDGRKKILGKVKTSTTNTLGHCLNETLMMSHHMTSHATVNYVLKLSTSTDIDLAE